MDTKNNKNQEVGKEISNTALNLKTISIFQNDAQIIFIFKKTERLTSAIYLLTSFISDNNPIKEKLRDSATRLLSYSISLSGGGHLNRIEVMNNYTMASFEILSMIEVAKISEIISAMNYSILKFEFEKIIEAVESKERSLNSKLLFSKSFFEIRDESPIAFSKQSIASESIVNVHKRQIIQTIPNKENADREVKEMPPKGQSVIKDKISDKGHISGNKNLRYETIINLLKKTKEITIKDVSSIISDCSEKTIQRELLSLVEKGVLKKEGERRWSRYSLAS